MNSFPIPRFLKNFYLVTGIIFIVWILFFDSNDLISQYMRQKRLKTLKEEKNYYEQETKVVEEAYKQIIDDPKAIEKLARERYLLKKPHEDVFIIEEVEPSKEDPPKTPK